MGERRTLGQILMSFGRIDDEDVGRALAYQGEHGGYFGEALLALGYVTPEELEWGLAAQFDLPYVFPEAEAIDPEAASLVSPEGALTHLTLPIMKTADTLTVIVDSPIKTEAVDQLEARTDRRIELALAPAAKIRELIRKVFGRDDVPEEGQRAVSSLGEVLTAALDAGSKAFGISTRGAWAHGWYDERGTVRRIALNSRWQKELAEFVTPSTPEGPTNGPRSATWPAHVAREGVVASVQVSYLSSPGGTEYLFRPIHERSALYERFSPPTSGIVSEIRLLARTGAARFAVTFEPAQLAGEMLPYLPALLFEPSWRCVHVTDRERTVPEDVFAIRVSGETEARASAVRALRSFHFDVATVDLSGPPETWARAAADVATVTFLFWEGGGVPSTEADIRWELRVQSPSDGQVEWSLHPLSS
jgi:hypothetical protein